MPKGPSPPLKPWQAVLSGGWRRGQMVVLSARPSMGKSFSAQSLHAQQQALEESARREAEKKAREAQSQALDQATPVAPRVASAVRL